MTTINQFIEVLKIVAKYHPKGMDSGYWCGAEHDELYLYVPEEISEEDIKTLTEDLGMCYDESDGLMMMT